MNNIKKGDEVIVITGKDKGKRGKVRDVLVKTNKVIVDGINLVKKHVKPNPKSNQQGGIVDREAPLPVSKVAVYNPMTKRADKVGIKILDGGRKVRYFKSNKELVDIIS